MSDAVGAGFDVVSLSFSGANTAHKANKAYEAKEGKEGKEECKRAVIMSRSSKMMRQYMCSI
jgi:hypothetical protein